MCLKNRERERERDTHRERERERDRQTDRQAGRQTDRDRQTDRTGLDQTRQTDREGEGEGEQVSKQIEQNGNAENCKGEQNCADYQQTSPCHFRKNWYRSRTGGSESRLWWSSGRTTAAPTAQDARTGRRTGLWLVPPTPNQQHQTLVGLSSISLGWLFSVFVFLFAYLVTDVYDCVSVCNGLCLVFCLHITYLFFV